MKRILKYIGITLGVILFLLLAVVGISQTSFFRNWLKNRIVSRVNQRLNGQLSIVRLDGNLFTNVQLNGILLAVHNDTLAYVPRLSIDISPSRLLHRELQIDSISIDSPYCKLVQNQDSSWNLSGLMRYDSVSTPAPAKKDTTVFAVRLNDFIVRNGSILLQALDTSLPYGVKNLGLRFNAQYSDTAQQLALKEFSFTLEKPDFRLEQFSLSASRHGNKITLGDLVIKTAKNQMGGQGTYVASDSATSSGNLKSSRFDFSELQMFIPGLTLYGSPQFEFHTSLKQDSLAITLGVMEKQQRIDFRLSALHADKALSAATRDQVQYHLNVSLTDFDLASWLGDSTMDFQASGTLDIAGHGFTEGTADASLQASLTGLRVLGKSVQELNATLQYANKNLDGQMNLVADFGTVGARFGAQDLLDSQTFQADLTASHLNLAPILTDDSVTSDLNLTAAIRGAGFDRNRVSATGEIAMSRSSMFHEAADTGFARGKFTAETYQIDTLFLKTPIGEGGLSGKGAFKGENDFRFGARLTSLSPLRAISRADTLSGTGTVTGTATGTADSIDFHTDVQFQNLFYNTYGIKTLQGQVTALNQKEHLAGKAEFSATDLAAPPVSLDSLAIVADFKDSSANLTLDAVYKKGIDGHLVTQVAVDSLVTATIGDLVFNFQNDRWKGGGSGSRVVIAKNNYRIDNLALTCPLDSGRGMQTIALSGLFSMTGPEDLQLKIDHLDLFKLATAFETPTELRGYLAANVSLKGTASAPDIEGTLSVDSGAVNQFSYQAIHSSFKYGARNFNWNFSLLPYQADSLSINGFIPMNLALDNRGELLLRDQPMQINVSTLGLPLSVIQASGRPFKQVQGLITADLAFSNTLNAPSASGSFGLRGGKVSLPKYGIDYTDILTHLTIHDARLTLDTLLIRRDQGYTTGSGSLDFDKSLLSGTIKTTQFGFVTKEFYVVRHKDYQIEITGDAQFTGSGNEPKFGGKITVGRSSWFLPAVMEEAAAQQAAADRSVPLLVKATRAQDSLTDTSRAIVQRIPTAGENERTDWYQNLRGQFKVTIPRNTWLRSPDLNLEIGEGDIDLVKNGPDFEIFGPIKILRGQYNMYGKRFTILQGSLLFQGGKEYNPEISMQAQYIFRTAEREKKTLKLDVSGKAFSPVLQFTLDDQAIEERDALAYVMYGRSMDELTSGQKSGAGAAQQDLAKGAAANMLSSQLSQTLGSKLGLDVVDISSQGSLAAATVTVGKYLTNDLFMSYQKSLGQSQDQNATPEIVTLEYELNKFFSLQLLQGDEKTSGVDFIFKFQH